MVEKSCALVEQLKTIPDPRRQGQNLKHRLEDVLLLGFCGTLAGCDDFVEIAQWASLHQEFFRTFLELENGIPSHDTFNRLFALIPPSTLQNVLLPWLRRQRGLPGDWIPIDGKTMRGTRNTSAGLGALHLVSAWATEAGLTLGQVAVDEKSNEITAIPQLLELLDLQEKIVTIDAIGCQKEIAEAIVQGGGDYVLAVKDNQPTLHQQIQAAFQTASTKEICTSITQEKGHGRQECREVHVLPVSAKEPCLDSWKGLKNWVMVVRMVTCLVRGVTTREVSYFMSSGKISAQRLGQAIRGHWAIESMHWVLDVVFREDQRRLYDRTAAENVAWMNRVALSLLRGDPMPGSLKVKRKKAGWDIRYLAQLLGFPAF